MKRCVMKSRFQSACLTYHPVPKQPFLTPNQAHLLASGQSSTLRVDSAQVLTLNNIFSKVSSEEPDGRRLRKQKLVESVHLQTYAKMRAARKQRQTKSSDFASQLKTKNEDGSHIHAHTADLKVGQFGDKSKEV